MIDEKSIAVLPFENISSDVENEYFADGMTEEIITALSKIEGLKVTARTSSFAYKGKKIDIRHIGNELGVSTVLEGSIRKAQNNIRVTAQLIRTDNGFHIWSDNFDRKLENIFQLQDEISLLIADKIRENFGHINIGEHLVKEQTSNVEAYDLYLKGKFYFFTWNLLDIEKAIKYFQKAIELEPNYDLPYFGASLCYSLLAAWGYLDKGDAIEKAKTHYENGAKIDQNSVEHYFSKAVIQFWGDWDYKGAFLSLQEAHKINPQNAEPIDFMAEIGRSIGDFKAAMEFNAKGLKVNPLSPNAHFTKSTLYYLQNSFDQALVTIDKGLSIDPNFQLLHHLKAACLIQMKKKGDLWLFIENQVVDPLLAKMAKLLYPLYHQQEVDQRLLEEVFAEINGLNYPLLYPWDIYLNLYNNDEEAAIQLLEKRVKEKNGQVINFKNDPLWTPIRSYDSFQQFVKQSFPDHLLDLKVADSKKETKKSNEVLNEVEVAEYKTALLAKMEEEELYTDPSISLRSLAAEIDLHPNKLSWLLNEKVGQNFNDFINTYRLESFQLRALDPKNKHLTLLGLALESGFNSKTVFNDFFKKNTGQTPKAWIKAAQKS